MKLYNRNQCAMRSDACVLSDVERNPGLWMAKWEGAMWTMADKRALRVFVCPIFRKCHYFCYKLADKSDKGKRHKQIATPDLSATTHDTKTVESLGRVGKADSRNIHQVSFLLLRSIFRLWRHLMKPRTLTPESVCNLLFNNLNAWCRSL